MKTYDKHIANNQSTSDQKNTFFPKVGANSDSFFKAANYQGGAGLRIQKQTGEEAGESAPSCSCNPPITNQCSSGQNDKIMAAFQLAARWLPGARLKIQEYRAAVRNNRPLPGRATRALSNHFNWTEAVRQNLTYPDIPRMVGEVIDNSFRNIGALICSDCPSTAADEVNGEDTTKIFASSPRPWSHTNCYQYYPAFFNGRGGARNRLRARIIIHEMMHSWEGKSDIAYEGDSNYPPNVNAAQFNADSYAALIRDLR